jgi:predicted phosphohydrolase
MDIFGGAWENYREKIIENFKNTLLPDDTLVIAGDVSWAMSLDEALADFRLLSSLPSKKLIVKGNHDLMVGHGDQNEALSGAKRNFGGRFLLQQTVSFMKGRRFAARGAGFTGRSRRRATRKSSAASSCAWKRR